MLLLFLEKLHSFNFYMTPPIWRNQLIRKFSLVCKKIFTNNCVLSLRFNAVSLIKHCHTSNYKYKFMRYCKNKETRTILNRLLTLKRNIIDVCNSDEEFQIIYRSIIRRLHLYIEDERKHLWNALWIAFYLNMFLEFKVTFVSSQDFYMSNDFARWRPHYWRTSFWFIM